MILVLLITLALSSIVVSPPRSIVNGRSLQIDIGLSPGQRLHVERIVACSAIDMPFVAYDPDAPSTSGCNSSGYTAVEIYSASIASSPAGSLASKFRVRQQKNSVLMRRHLINRHAPTVRLQMHLSAHASDRSVVTDRTVTILHYRVDELTLPIDSTEPNGGSSGIGGKNVFGAAIQDDGRDDEMQFTGVESVDKRNPWYLQTIGMFAIFAFGAGVALVIWLRVTKKASKLNASGNGDYQQKHYRSIASFLSRATSLGFYASVPTSPPPPPEKV